ncbi:MAG: hypothetical protein OHK0039_48890 [Bacteroidia bacterium]
MKRTILQRICILLIAGLVVLRLPAQQISVTEDAVYRLTDAGFLQTYKDYRAETEEYVALFKAKAKEENYSPEELIHMKSAYRRTSEAFEDFIYAIRNDLLDPKMRKKIRKDTEGYVRQRLIQLQSVHDEYFLERFHSTYVAIVQGPEYNTIASADVHRTDGISPTIPIALIAPMTRATMDVIDYLDKKKDRDMIEVKQVLEKEWIAPHRFRNWEEI